MMINNEILFPYLNNNDKYQKLKIDQESVKYITTRTQSEIIMNIILKHVKNSNLQTNKINITDMTAGVGGNTLAFGMIFAHVNAIEINYMRAYYLKHNVEIYELNNINVLNENAVTEIKNLKHDIIFIDPPWENYKYSNTIRLLLGNIKIEFLINLILNGFINISIPKFIVLKLPKNYDMNFFFKTVNFKNIAMYKTKKMLIIVITK